ncbi:hypothetical protein AGABI2DRAFT_188579 [Agaricus bisporus var. bisporus H97]|uniref:hypothetical protein n=1 Tax=Agaricus bisporus var. bisporus (strain H97 / ATCC MYA-4626 / FGSC 10389) TaxID=936046 RepID=UPI00029F75EB|nr:hypothetical protein AGABI2DRAFT_188579 [Agaricus bisporus var. bisporus H97]EKV42411.1 hypothetical protein AGABI2DRAFT_188579 [Agaricus bisporus var. bisporus H97]
MIKNGNTFKKKWSPSNGVVNPAVISVLTQTARTEATRGNSQVMNNKIWQLRWWLSWLIERPFAFGPPARN